jgi:hypothetical protein
VLNITESQVRSDIKFIVNLLVQKDYQEIQNQKLHPFGDISILAERIREYSGTITMPPDHVFEALKFIKFKINDDNFFFQADLDLWFDNSESDLTAQFVPSMDQSKTLICLYDLHVL